MKIGTLSKYCQRVLGRGSVLNTSIYTLCCEALEVEGFPKPPFISDKKWVLQNHEQMGIKKKTVKQKKVRNVIGDSFLESYAWRKLRMEALIKYGRRCQCCGTTPEFGGVMNVDHIKPRKLFPDLALQLDNLQVLCHQCNHGKGNWDQTDWRK